MWRLCSHALTHSLQQEANYTRWRIRSIWHPYSKYSLALSNWIVNHLFYFQFKKYHKGYTAPEMGCKTKFLLLVVCALPLFLEADPCPVVLLRRGTQERCLFCSRAFWTVCCSESWHVPHSQLGGTACLAVTTCPSTGKAKLHFLGLIYLCIYLFKSTSPIVFIPVRVLETEQCRHTALSLELTSHTHAV